MLRGVPAVALHTRYHQQNSDELPAHYGIIFVYPLDKTLLCGIPYSFLPGHKGRERGENHVAKDLDGAFHRFCVLFLQLVALGIAHRKGWSSFALYLHALRWLYLPADGRRMDEPTAQKQSDERCIQYGE